MVIVNSWLPVPPIWSSIFRTLMSQSPVCALFVAVNSTGPQVIFVASIDSALEQGIVDDPITKETVTPLVRKF